jgi:hypothetical protein
VHQVTVVPHSWMWYVSLSLRPGGVYVISCPCLHVVEKSHFQNWFVGDTANAAVRAALGVGGKTHENRIGTGTCTTPHASMHTTTHGSGQEQPPAGAAAVGWARR